MASSIRYFAAFHHGDARMASGVSSWMACIAALQRGPLHPAANKPFCREVARTLRALFPFGVPVTTPSAPVRLDHAAVRRIILGLMLAMFLSALDQTIVATALATIGRAYADVTDLAWIVTAYLLAATAVTPVYGKLADIHGRRPVLLAGIAIFVAGSVACALSPTMPALIAARALQGLGGGGLIALSQTIVGDAVSPRERGRYQGYFGIADDRLR